MQTDLKSKPEPTTKRQRTEEEKEKRREYDRVYQKKNRERLSQRQRERRAEKRAERAKNKPVEEPKEPKPIKSTPKPLMPPKTAENKVGIKGEAVRRSRVKEKRVLAVDVPKPINETLIKKLGWIMSEERKYILSEVLYGITPSKKGTELRDALEYFERVLFTAEQLEVFGTRLRKMVVAMNLNEPRNQIKVITERQNETIIGFKFEDEWGKIMFVRFKEIKGNYCESD
nr:MAG TPA: hypothetical protein [Caudoviricetes sp.]